MNEEARNPVSDPIQAALSALEGMDELFTDGIDALNEMADRLDAHSESLRGLADAVELSGHEPQAAVAASLRDNSETLGDLSGTLRRLAAANGTLRGGHRLLRQRLQELH